MRYDRVIRAQQRAAEALRETQRAQVARNRHVTNEYWHYVGALAQPGFENDWSNANVEFMDAAFRRDDEGFVYVVGLVQHPYTAYTNANWLPVTSYSHIFTLPAGYRQGRALVFSQPEAHTATQGVNTFGEYAARAVEIRANGEVHFHEKTNFTGGTTQVRIDFLSLAMVFAPA